MICGNKLAYVSDRLSVEIQVPISCGEVAVVPGDIIVGDEEGVIVIPVHIHASTLPLHELQEPPTNGCNPTTELVEDYVLHPRVFGCACVRACVRWWWQAAVAVRGVPPP